LSELRANISSVNREYEGWKNYVSWNVSLWINNEYPLYQSAVAFMKTYKGKAPYKNFIAKQGLINDRTPDRIKWLSDQLDYSALNEMMREINE